MSPRRLIIVADADQCLPEDEERITRYLIAKGWEVWHWFGYFWLVTGAPDELTLEDLFGEIHDLVGKLRVVVFDVEKHKMKGYVPHKSMPWLHEHWWGTKPS